MIKSSFSGMVKGTLLCSVPPTLCFPPLLWSTRASSLHGFKTASVFQICHGAKPVSGLSRNCRGSYTGEPGELRARLTEPVHIGNGAGDAGLLMEDLGQYIRFLKIIFQTKELLFFNEKSHSPVLRFSELRYLNRLGCQPVQ